MSCLAATFLPQASTATVIYTYDFPGSPGSGLAAAQTNGQPPNGTFSDFVRVGGLNVVGGGGGTNVFGSNNWNQTGSIDLSQYEGFTITSAAGYHLELTDVGFQVKTSATGLGNMRVALYVNGSTTAFATFDLSPTTTMTAYSFDFTDLTPADNATTVDIRFYGWNAGGAGSQVFLDNVTTSGIISNVPEFEPAWIAFLVIAVSLVAERRRARARMRNDADVTGKICRSFTGRR